MQNIYVFTDSYPYGLSETFFDIELKYLASRFSNIYIIPLFSNNSQKRALPDNVYVFNPPFTDPKRKIELLKKGLFNLSPLNKYFKQFFDFKVYKSFKKFWIWSTHMLLTRALKAYLKKSKLLNIFYENNLIYFYWGIRWSYIIPFIENKNARIIVRFHRSDLYEELMGYMPLRNEQIKGIDLVLFISEFGMNYFKDKYPFYKGKMILSRLGTLDRGLNSYISNEYKVLVSCSNLVPVKRVDIIANCLKFLNHKIKWVHFGDGPERPKIEKIVSKLPENISVVLEGRVDNNYIMRYYENNSIDLFINVSSSEGIPVSIMEALSFGIPVIATNVGGTSEIVDNEVGMLICPDITPELLAQKIGEILFNKNYQEFRKKARIRWEERCNADKLFNNFIEELFILLNK